MPRHDYTPREALDLLLRNVASASIVLANRIQVAIDSGADIQAEETVRPGPTLKEPSGATTASM